jgi:hypothetical protein
MKHVFLKRMYLCSFLLTGGQFLTGCALFQDWMNSESLAEYGESVFKRQNLITSQIMLLPETQLSGAQSQKLQQAEAKMHQDCKLLNDYAVREMDNANIDLVFKKKVRDSIESCDFSIQQIENTLTELGISIDDD